MGIRYAPTLENHEEQALVPVQTYYDDFGALMAPTVYYPPEEPKQPEPWSMMGNVGPPTTAHASDEERYSLDAR
ncbi:hypothetical protein, partial [Enterobacter cloacae complex sp. 4DZ1-17B1]|uniref:hypothetical protein n=1 Tax=Enterobacter cloacae complex sp. 4DZ1-17B1 TaxID=2511991 RepID=UPI001CA5E2A8